MSNRHIALAAATIWIGLCLTASLALADEASDAKQLAAIPSIVGQRNDALNALAFCGGDTTTLQAKIVVLQKQLDEANAKNATPGNK